MAFIFTIIPQFYAWRKCLVRCGGDGDRRSAEALGWANFRILTFCLAGAGKNLIYGFALGIGLTTNAGI